MIERPDSLPKKFVFINQAVSVSGLSRTHIYEALNRGDLKAVKAGRRTLIPYDDLMAYLASLPAYQPGGA
jgi:excisionase family DNA binding protein